MINAIKRGFIIAIIAITLINSVISYELSDYPRFFVDEGRQVYIVIGKAAKTDDVIGGIDIAVSLTSEYVKNGKMMLPIAVFDNDIVNYEQYNMIVVGGPCVNSAAAYLMRYPEAGQCAVGFEAGTSRIRIYEQITGKIHMLVAGLSGYDTTRAAYVLSHYKDYTDKLVGKNAVIETGKIKEVSVN